MNESSKPKFRGEGPIDHSRVLTYALLSDCLLVAAIRSVKVMFKTSDPNAMMLYMVDVLL